MSQLVLMRLSASYSEYEDRIRLASAGQVGASVDMWLTQRLLGLIIGHLGRSLEQKATAGVPAKSRQASNASHVSSLEQKFASDHYRNPEAVKLPPSAPKSLIHTIDITTGPSTIRLVFKGEGGISVMDFDQVSLRQWLHVLYILSERAGWKSIAWPDWVASAAKPGPRMQRQ
jgi:hypothetical protein